MTGRWDALATPGTPSASYGQRNASSGSGGGIDPYFRWALATDWRGFARGAGPGLAEEPVRIIALAPDLATLKQLVAPGKAAAADPNWPQSLKVSEVYGQAIPGTKHRPLYFTATLSRADLQKKLLPAVPSLRWRLALPLRDAGKAAQASSKGLFGPTRDAQEMTATNLVMADIQALPNLAGATKLAGAIALIDSGCPFLNTAFENADRSLGTRVAALWDQGACAPPLTEDHKLTGWPWTAPCAFDHGREMGPAALRAVTLAARSNRLLEETAIYRGLDYLIDYQDQRRRVWYGTHGGHLLDLAAGSTDPLSRSARRDPAASANLVFVDLPMSTAMDSAGGSLAAHLLDGVRYVLSICKPRSPVVINISYGAQAGPHDGSSLIEEALDDLLAHSPGNLAIVLAAGNARQLRGHARRTVRRERSALLRVLLPEGDTTDSFVELWYEPPALGHIQLRVRAPNQQWSPWAAAGEEVALRAETPARGVVALLRHDRKVPNGRRSMALMAVVPTAQPMDVPCELADAGVWEIEVHWQDAPDDDVGQAGVAIDAWIERDDPARNSQAERPQFVDQDHGDEHNTLSSIATGTRTLSVGGFNLGTRLPAAYSALGPEASHLPHVLATCEEDESSPTIAAAATRSGEVARLNGTSVAAPVLARRLYNQLTRMLTAKPEARLQTADEWRQALDKLARDDKQIHIRPFTKD